MQIDPAQQSISTNYKLLTSLVVPRPIAWITSLSPTGVVNLAPYSFFNAVGTNPPYIIVSVGRNDDGSLKDTARNIVANSAFVVHMVTEELFDAMNISAANFPSEASEVDATNLHTVPSAHISVPRLAEAKVSMECKLHSVQRLGMHSIFIGEVVMYHVADELLNDRMRICNFIPIGRMGGGSVYCRTNNQFDDERITYADWCKGR